MHAIPEAVARLANDANGEGAAWPRQEVIARDGFVAWFGPPIYPELFGVSRLRLRAPDIPAAITDVRALAAERDLRHASWLVGRYSQPEDLTQRLVDAGMSVGELLVPMVLGTRPPQTPSGVDVAVASTAEDLLTFYDIQCASFGTDEKVAAAGREHVRAQFEAERDGAVVSTFIASIDGVPVATARATFTEHGVVLNGGGTLPEYRGRGAYRALVSARWEAAAAAGKDYLVTMARATSYPILSGLGFEQVGEVSLVVDEF